MTAIEFDLLEVLRLVGLVGLVRSGVTAMEFDLIELILPRPSLGGWSEFRLRDPVLWEGDSLAGCSEFLLRDPVLCILLLQLWLYCCLTAALLAAAGSRAELDLWTETGGLRGLQLRLFPLRLPRRSRGLSLPCKSGQLSTLH